MRVVVRFAGILTFVRQQDEVVVFAAEAGLNKDLRIPEAFWPNKEHDPLITFGANVKFQGDKPARDARGRSFKLEPRGDSAWRKDNSWVDLNLLNLTDLCHQNKPTNEPRSAVILDSRLRQSPPYPTKMRTLAGSRFEMEPDMVSATCFDEKWPMNRHSPLPRSHPAEITFVLSTEGDVVLKHRPLFGEKGGEQQVVLTSKEPNKPIEIFFNHLYKGNTHRHAPHYAVHYHLMSTPQELLSLLPVPEPPKGGTPPSPGKRTTPLDYGPASLNPQCSPAELSTG